MRVFSMITTAAAGFGSISFANAQMADPMIVGGRPADLLEYPYYV